MEAAGEKNLFEKDREVVGRGFDIRDLAAITAVEPADLLQDRKQGPHESSGPLPTR